MCLQEKMRTEGTGETHTPEVGFPARWGGGAAGWAPGWGGGHPRAPTQLLCWLLLAHAPTCGCRVRGPRPTCSEVAAEEGPRGQPPGQL